MEEVEEEAEVIIIGTIMEEIEMVIGTIIQMVSKGNKTLVVMQMVVMQKGLSINYV